MPRITPSTFWPLYKSALRLHGSWSAYQSDALWTPIAKQAAEAACEGLSLKHSREYLRLDVLGYEECESAHHDWTARVAFEVENSARWKDELCKLAHVVADLCVLSAYQLHKTWTCEEALADYLQTLGDRVCRVPGRQWLFIFGPACAKPDDCWTAYTLDPQRQLVSVDAPPPLRGVDLGVK